MYRHLLAFSNTSKHQRDADSEPRAIFFYSWPTTPKYDFLARFVFGAVPLLACRVPTHDGGGGVGDLSSLLSSPDKFRSCFLNSLYCKNIQTVRTMYSTPMFLSHNNFFFIKKVWTTLRNFLRPYLNRRYAWVACVSRPFIRWLLIVYVIATVAPF